MEKKYVISVRNYAQEFKLSGMQFMCRFDEPSRIVFVGADTMLIGTKGLQFSNHTWIVVTPSPTDPVRSSVVHMCVRLSVDRVEGGSTYTEDRSYAHDLVLTDLCARFRQHSLYVQNWIVDETERLAAGMPTTLA